MAVKLKIKKGDEVIVRTGKDKGKKGTVIKVFPSNSKVLVSGVNVVKKHSAPKQGNPGGIVEQEAPLHISNVGVIDPKSGDKPTRIGIKSLDDGSKVRYAKVSDEVIS